MVLNEVLILSTLFVFINFSLKKFSTRKKYLKANLWMSALCLRFQKSQQFLHPFSNEK